jgi:glucosamine-phosphate N-acetyltransferase
MSDSRSDVVLNIRPCSMDDFDAVARLLRQLWPERHLDVDSLRTVFGQAITSDPQVFLCVVSGQGVIGFASLSVRNSLWQEGKLGHVDELVVDAEHRNRGVGTRLLEHLVALARQRGCRRMELDSAFHRKDSHQFYERHGFENGAFHFSKTL